MVSLNSRHSLTHTDERSSNIQNAAEILTSVRDDLDKSQNGYKISSPTPPQVYIHERFYLKGHK